MKCYNLSYEKVNIDTAPNDTVVYIDPPYKGTTVKGYSFKEIKKIKWFSQLACSGKGRYYEKTIKETFDYDKLYEYCHDLAQKGYKVYMSEYSCDSPYAEEIWCREKRNNFSVNKSSNNNIERLYIWH